MVWTSLLNQDGVRSAGALGAAPTSQAASFFIRVVNTYEELVAQRQAWDDLARNALEANVFYESWMLLPAIRAFGQGLSLRFVLVFAGNENSPGELCGLFPLERRWGYKGLPVSYFSLWQHRQLFLGSPLLRGSCARDCLSAFLEWLRSQMTGALLEWPLLPAEGPVNQLLADWMGQRPRCFVSDQYARPLLRRHADAEAYIQSALSSRLRRDLRRREKDLKQLGPLEIRELQSGDPVQQWTAWFMHLESSGWKGREGTAMACRTADRDFFHTIVAEAFQRGQLQMLGLFLNGEPIAMKCNLLSPQRSAAHGNGGRSSFAFKLAFDERHSTASPGYHLEVGNIQELHRRKDIEWMDSCSAPGPSVYDRLWLDRRPMHTLLMSTGRLTGNVVVSLLPRLRRLKQGLADLARKFRGDSGAVANDVER